MYHYKSNDLFKENEVVAVTTSVFIKGGLLEHMHDYVEIAYIYSGNGYHVLNGEFYEIKKGDLFFISKNSHHTFVSEDENLKWINIMFLPEAIDKKLLNISSLSDILNLTVFSGTFSLSKISLTDVSLFQHEQDFHDIFFAMYEEYEARKLGYQDILKNYLAILLTKIFRALSENPNRLSGKQSNLVDNVLEYLASHSLEYVKPEDIAKNAFFSPAYFPKLFKKKTGKTLNHFIREVKIKFACDLLVTTNHSIIQVMHEAGYSDTKFFYAIFKEFTGMTPAQYRKNVKQNFL